MIHARSLDATHLLRSPGGGKTLVEYRQNHVIFSQGDIADSILYIQKGNVKLAVVSDRGKEGVIAILRAQDFLGETCLAGQRFRTAFATAITQCTLMKIERLAMVRMLREEPAFSEFFLSYLLSNAVRVQEQLVDQLFNSSERRLARALLLLAHFDIDDKAERVVPRITQETLAEMIGATRETVNHLMNKFKRLGFIGYEGGLKVHSSLLRVLLNN